MNDVDELLARHASRWQEAAALPEARLPERRPRRLVAVRAAAALAVAALTGAGLFLAQDGTRAPLSPGAARPVDGAGARVPAGSVDRYDAQTAAILGAFATGGAGSEAEQFASLREAYRSATAAVLGRMGDVRVTRTVNGVTYVGVVLTDVTVLRGALRDPSAEVVVEFLGEIDAVRAAAPSGYGVWLLRNKAEVAPGVTVKPGAPGSVDESPYYRLVSSQGLFVQDETHVVNPVRERTTAEAGAPSPAVDLVPRDPVAREAEAFPTLSALVAHLRLMA